MILIGEIGKKILKFTRCFNYIREYYNSDLADEMDNLIPEHSDDEYEDLAFDLNNKEEKIISLEDEIDTLENKVETLEEKIEELENK